MMQDYAATAVLDAQAALMRALEAQAMALRNKQQEHAAKEKNGSALQ